MNKAMKSDPAILCSKCHIEIRIPNSPQLQSCSKHGPNNCIVLKCQNCGEKRDMSAKELSLK